MMVLHMDKLHIGIKILKRFKDFGYEAYMIGGAVRDYIMQCPIQDVDITTNALPSQVAQIFDDVQMEGEAYLSCRVIMEGVSFEVTTYRKDIESIDHRHPASIKADSLKEDIIRRDFTMNAIAMNERMEIIDFLNGKKDIQDQVIRVIGSSDVRFNEDALRVLRALDFSSRFNFVLDDDILQSFQKDYIRFLKEEYIYQWLTKIMNEPYLKGLEYIKDYQLFRSFPFYQVVAEEAYSFGGDGFYIFACKHGFIPSNTRLPKRKIEDAMKISFLVRHHFDDYSLYHVSSQYWEDALHVYQQMTQTKITKDFLNQKYKELPIHQIKDIDYDFNLIPSHQRAIKMKKVELAILKKEINNQFDEISNYLFNEENGL